MRIYPVKISEIIKSPKLHKNKTMGLAHLSKNADNVRLKFILKSHGRTRFAMLLVTIPKIRLIA